MIQLKAIVSSLLGDSSINFDRFCFYGCYCLPDAAIHDSSPGTGKPVDEVDNACKECVKHKKNSKVHNKNEGALLC